MLPKKSSLDTLSNQALCKLRDEIAEELKSCAENLERQIDQLVGPTSSVNTEHRGGPRKGHKVAPKYKPDSPDDGSSCANPHADLYIGISTLSWIKRGGDGEPGG